MKKKLLVLLLIITVAAFVFVGCTPPTPSEGEGEGEGEPTVTIDIAGAHVSGGKTYVRNGSYDITVTFDTPTDNVIILQSECVGDQSRANGYNPFFGSSNVYPVPLWSSADKKVWTGKIIFDCDPCEQDDCTVSSGCCATMLWVEYGDCDNCEISLPVIVDCEAPWAQLVLNMTDCGVCEEGCNLSITTKGCSVACEDGFDLCGDSHHAECPECGDVYDCSGLSSWSLVLYEDDPFVECCDIDTGCFDPVWEASGTSCPISASTGCLTDFMGEKVIVGYTPVYEEVCEDDEVIPGECIAWTKCYCASPDTQEGVYCFPNPDTQVGGYLCECECDEDQCCEWDDDEVIEGECHDVVVNMIPIYEYECKWFFLVLTMEDNVGNVSRFGAWIATSGYPNCKNLCIEEEDDHICLDEACNVFTTELPPCDCFDESSVGAPGGNGNNVAV